jgi:PAS domain-containing protein
MDSPPGAAGAAAQSLLALLAGGGGRTAAVALLHQRALQVTGGLVSLLFEPNPAGGHMQATSGAGLDALPGLPWTPGRAESMVIAQAFGGRIPVVIPYAAASIPALQQQVGTASIVLLPLVADTRRVGLLAIGVAADTPVSVDALRRSDILPGFLVSLELSHQRQRYDFEQNLRELLDSFSTSLSSTLELTRALTPLCGAMTRLFGADRTTVWLHDRARRAVVTFASSDPALMDPPMSVRADDPVDPAAVALRSPRAGLSNGVDAATSLLSIPLRGCRRALGVVICEGVRIEPGDDVTLLVRADELGRRLGSAVETVHLVQDIVRARQELEQLFASIVDLIVVLDAEGCIVRANRSFAAAVTHAVDTLPGRPLASVTGPELSTWLASLPLSLGEPAVCELTDAILGGPYAVTVTDLPPSPGTPAARVIVASDLLPVLAQRAIPGE